MNNNIDFSDFNKIAIEHNSRFRKFTKHKFIIFVIISIIILAILIIVYLNKESKFSKKNKELNEINDKILINNSNLGILKHNLTVLNNTMFSLNNLEELITQYNILEKKYNSIKKFERISSTQVKKKCYDSKLYGFNPEIFHNKCDGNSLLFLIKTETDEFLGAYTSNSCKEKKDIQEIDSLLINFDNDKFFKYSSNDEEKCLTFYSSKNFSQFGEDLIIFNNGDGETKFPYCYGVNEGNQGVFSNNNKFYLDMLEVYTVEII